MTRPQKDLDEFIKEQAERAKREYERTQQQKLPSLYRQALRRARLRRAVRNAGGGFIALATLVALVAMPASVGKRPPVAPGVLAIAANGEHVVNRPNEYGFWPFARRELSRHVCGSSLLRGSKNAATRFAASMFQWTDVVTVGENRFGNRVTTTIAELPDPFTAEGPFPPRPVIRIELERLGSDNCWWVTGVGDPRDEAGFSARAEDADLQVSFDLLPGSERADLVVVEASNNVRRYVTGKVGDTSVRIDDFRGPGFVVVLWIGSDGEVFSASGATLPAGDSSIRAR